VACLVLTLGVFLILALRFDDAVHFPPSGIVGWLLLCGVCVPVYLLLEIVGEAIAETLHDDSRLLVRLLPIGAIVLAYVVWYSSR
jgi:hypothetical protein